MTRLIRAVLPLLLWLSSSVTGLGAALPPTDPSLSSATAEPTIPWGQQRNRDRAESAFAAMQHYFYQDGAGLYREQYPYTEGKAYSFLWPFSHALAATAAIASMPGLDQGHRAIVHDQLAGLDAYWNDDVYPPAYDSYVRAPLGHGGDRYYDDNAWIGLELVKVYRATGDPVALTDALRVFYYLVSGWDTDPNHPAPGGIFWIEGERNRQRVTVSTAAGALLGFHLFELTQNQYYFDRGWDMYSWTNRYMLAPNGLYWDNISLDGTIDTHQHSYNQGAMIGASLLLGRITGDRGYLLWAEHIGASALSLYGDFDPHTPGAERTYMNAILFENLLLLDRETCSATYQAEMQAYANRLWDLVQFDVGGLLRFSTAAPVYLLDQAALVRLYAQLAEDQPPCIPPTTWISQMAPTMRES